MKMKWTQITPDPINWYYKKLLKISYTIFYLGHKNQSQSYINLYLYFEKKLLCLYPIFHTTALNILYLSIPPFLRNIYYSSIDDNHPYYLQLIYLSTLNNCWYRVYIVLLIHTNQHPTTCLFTIYTYENTNSNHLQTITPTMEW